MAEQEKGGGEQPPLSVEAEPGIVLVLTADELQVLKQVIDTYEIRGNAASLVRVLPIFQGLQLKLTQVLVAARQPPTLPHEASHEESSQEGEMKPDAKQSG